MNMTKKISDGVYIVVDPLRDQEAILEQLRRIKQEAVAAVQIWDNPQAERIQPSLIDELVEIFSDTPTPVLINNRWELLQQHALDGVHFDALPADWAGIRKHISRPFIKGLTLQNALAPVADFNQLDFDYLSFCSLFPSSTAGQCEIVHPQTIEKCRQLTSKPIFLAGGINLTNLHAIRHLPANGIAVVSAIMDAEDPLERLRAFNNLINFEK